MGYEEMLDRARHPPSIEAGATTLPAASFRIFVTFLHAQPSGLF
jgi:hypothetical protein